MMTLFDAPDRESSCVRRSRTNTPLQSLGMLNETQRIEIGRALAIRLLRDEGHDDARIDRMFRMLACRDAADEERSACQSLLESLRQRYREMPEDASALLQIGDAADGRFDRKRRTRRVVSTRHHGPGERPGDHDVLIEMEE